MHRPNYSSKTPFSCHWFISWPINQHMTQRTLRWYRQRASHFCLRHKQRRRRVKQHRQMQNKLHIDKTKPNVSTHTRSSTKRSWGSEPGLPPKLILQMGLERPQMTQKAKPVPEMGLKWGPQVASMPKQETGFPVCSPGLIRPRLQMGLKSPKLALQMDLKWGPNLWFPERTTVFFLPA